MKTFNTLADFWDYSSYCGTCNKDREIKFGINNVDNPGLIIKSIINSEPNLLIKIHVSDKLEINIKAHKYNNTFEIDNLYDKRISIFVDGVCDICKSCTTSTYLLFNNNIIKSINILDEVICLDNQKAYIDYGNLLITVIKNNIETNIPYFEFNNINNFTSKIKKLMAFM
jgi:hypothetical protein